MNEHLSAGEILWCAQLVQEIAAIVREEKQNGQLSMQDVDGHVITLKYGDITVYVYSEKISIQGSGSGVKSYEDGLLWTLLQENSVKDRLLEKGSEEWLSKVDAAKPKLQTLPPEVLETVMRCGCLYCKGMRMMATDIAKAESDADMEARSDGPVAVSATGGGGAATTSAHTVRPWPWCWLRTRSTESGHRYRTICPVSVIRLNHP